VDLKADLDALKKREVRSHCVANGYILLLTVLSVVSQMRQQKVTLSGLLLKQCASKYGTSWKQ
jgi:hypothetical protein